ncbi:dipeptidyl aminopeptidase/acylaminoacyl peptidase [Amycolatopsis bartoniae]|uniref:Peptidase S9 n=1 Tax=Amycolatopsis bartoniae TaxID=941986 RepID=A0A8H9IPD3_9PSEU|nr:prolyl oligopeptidase family serine peptidase [Amycolatopsis bartoniae]MBB2939606.1 dipeptidyl aminopeptidase/acylaminoacyl peptidase [Amycolatopsis bartoniae]TVT07815.1 S9 family peptidase [Amycolatopsis bartoniae]GHF39571.1 peptidase S9 [Amycolatopsis bartoniae]
MTSEDPFTDLDGYVALPRAAGLALSPDGRRLVVGVSALDAGKTRYTSALWEVDPAGERPARRLTRSKEGESGAAFTRDGDLLFVSSRPVPDAEEEGDAPRALWRQPAAGGDAEVLAAPPGGVHGVVVAREAGTVVFASPMLPSAADAERDRELRRERKDGKVSAILHEEYPVRFWDHDLGPARNRLLAGKPGDEPRDLTGHAGRALDDESTWDVSPDGGTVAASWMVAEPGGSQRSTLVAIDVATGERRVLADDAGHEYTEPRFSPDGSRIAVVVQAKSTPAKAGDAWLAVLPADGGEPQALTAGWDRWPHDARWLPDGSALVVTADDQGNAPLWRVDATTGEVTRLTERGAFSDVQVSPDGRWAYALRSFVDSPPAPYRVALDGSAVEALPGPVPEVTVPGRVEEVTTTAADGAKLRAWLALPHDAGPGSPAPLLLWIHGGPLGSWNAWQWRWNPWLAVAQGYAVLLPDPAISTGYGLDFIQRGWGEWGGAPYTDLMAITDAAVERADVDETRAAAMGGSFGGYMANWVAGHTGRFRAIVTHASLWSMDQFGPTTDAAYYWTRDMTQEAAARNSPNAFADRITTPMLVIHGDKDYRVPIGEGLRLWWDLVSRSAAEDGTTPHKFLYFPDENHWILTPNHVKVWYSTVLAFLAHHVLGQEWQRPELLG